MATPQEKPQGVSGKPNVVASVDTALMEAAEGQFPGVDNEPRIYVGKTMVKPTPLSQQVLQPGEYILPSMADEDEPVTGIFLLPGTYSTTELDKENIPPGKKQVKYIDKTTGEEVGWVLEDITPELVEQDVTLTLTEWQGYWNSLTKAQRSEYIELFKELDILGDKPNFMQIQSAWQNFGRYASDFYNSGSGIDFGDGENKLLEPLEILKYDISSAKELGIIEEDGVDSERLVKELTPEAELESFRNNVQSSLRTFASRNGIGLGEDYINSLTDTIVEGEDTLENIQLSLRQNYVANAFPSFSEQILQGRDVYDLASPYIAKMASVLEMNQFDITLDNPIIQKAIQAFDQNGKPITKPLWMFEQELKELPEYQFTDKGQSDARDLGMKLLKGFGLA